MIATSVLVFGASGGTGQNIIHQLDQTDPRYKPTVFAFCRNPDSFNKQTKDLCDGGVLKGDARNKHDIEKALRDSKADLVVVAVGTGESVKKSDIRTASAQAIASVLCKPKYQHVKALVVSSIGAGGSRIKVGMGIGRAIEFHIRHVLKDHNGQEAAFLSAMKDRTLIVRPTALTKDQPTGKVVLFDDLDKSPTIQTDRKDLADWLVKEAIVGNAVAGDRFGSKPINITCVK